jgi:hypothetical protein
VLLLVVLVGLLVGCSSREAVSVIDEVVVRPDDRTLGFAVSSCHGSPKATAEESASQVRIIVRSDTSSNDDCADGATVKLNQPLGDRDVVDAKTGRALRVRRT